MNKLTSVFHKNKYKNKKYVNICLIGFTNIGKIYFECINKIDKINILYCVDTNLNLIENIGKECNCIPTIDIIKPLKDKKVDIFIITEYSLLNEGYIISIIKAGKDIFIDNRACGSMEMINYYYSLSKEYNSLLYIGFHKRFNEIVNKLKDHYYKVGILQMVKISVFDSNKIINDNINICYDYLLQYIDIIRYITDSKIDQVFSYAIKKQNDKNNDKNNDLTIIDNYNIVNAILRINSELLCTIDISCGENYDYYENISIIGDNYICNECNNHLSSEEYNIKSYENMLNHFVDSLIIGSEVDPLYENYLENFSVAKAIINSIVWNRNINLHEFDEF